MKKLFFSLSALVTVSFFGCSHDNAPDANLLVESNFDTLAGWMPEPQSATLSADKAHSGRYSIKVDGAHEYSLGYHAPLGQLHDTRVKKIKVSAWALLPSPQAQALLVTTVSNPAAPGEKPLLWESMELNQTKTVGKWVEVSKVMTVPEAATPASVLGFYLWRTGGDQPIYLDDLRVTIEP